MEGIKPTHVFIEFEPVNMAARAGVHDGVDVQEFVNNMPEFAR